MKWLDICEISFDWGVSNRLRGHSYVTNCKDQTNHAQDRDIFKSLLSVDGVKTNQNGGFLSFRGKIALKNLLKNLHNFSFTSF